MTEVADEYLWLEDVEGQAALEWVRERNAETVAELAQSDAFRERQEELLEVLDSDDRIPYPAWRGEHFYSFWRDATNPRGLWRRTTLDEYRKDDPAWEILIDVDALAAQEGQNWVWNDVIVLRPSYARALICLSHGGSDAAIMREFDLRTKAFVPGGFTLPEAKHRLSWIDEDHLFVGTDFGDGSLTDSGYPRVVKRWKRGTPLSDAETVFEGEHRDVSARGFHDPEPGFERSFLRRSVDFFSGKSYLLDAAGQPVPIEVPDDSQWEVHREWMLIRPRTDWLGHPAGSLLAVNFDEFIAGSRELSVIYTPDDHSSLYSWAWTKNHLIVSLLVDVLSRLEVHTPSNGGWTRQPLPGVPAYGHSWIVDTDPDQSDSYLIASSEFLSPPSLHLGHIGGGEPELLKQAPAFFDSTGMTVRQFFATSADGTKVPYFVVGGDRVGPVLLTGYGGFDVSRTPDYDGTLGRGWLARGGVYVLANIRGGGEYGPRWHLAALREKRPRAYEDFAAVAADLVERGIASREQIGIDGGSNGGLLTGNMLTGYPQMFGAVVIRVPLLDMRRFHKLLAGASWMAEYGDPDNPEDWAFIRGFSPYHNVSRDASYPPVLLITSTRDDRVHPGHARKMTARLREFGHDVSYYENIEGGHGAAADNEQAAFLTALKYQFLWETCSGI
ncbi:prolyl oligopeptidase family serine peptidase [Catelliglobosispora koreensis]|uniref:prolyl oligopeptidase family serine peptidase n=1 Tax=Catelliglobosispora koreensis TaxID=129052 RepID=UPI0003722436|nr:prolyl oligopeptidase family serine peptidase [Catelliglobosispora koreensis]